MLSVIGYTTKIGYKFISYKEKGYKFISLKEKTAKASVGNMNVFAFGRMVIVSLAYLQFIEQVTDFPEGLHHDEPVSEVGICIRIEHELFDIIDAFGQHLDG